jgi:dihydropyrimidinase
MSILIKNGNIITATDNYVADIFIEGEVIVAIGKIYLIKQILLLMLLAN